MGWTETQTELLAQLQTAIGGLELPPAHPLRQDLAALSAAGDTFRIAFFAPFNYGKSTLLNAILGERTLPMDLIPTTGAAILVRHGTERQTQIRLVDGQVLTEPGTRLLEDYAILDGARRMRADVAGVTVWCPDPWLQIGVELLDLPGTDDQAAQDALVRETLLTADLVVQVLDGRKLMTLGEREQLRDWLQDRGIETVVFVVNFLNLLEPEDQKQVAQRMRFVAESFRSNLPAGVSNLYRVDALPALRARLKGDAAAAQMSGLPALEAALHTIVQSHQAQPQDNSRSLRIDVIAAKVKAALSAKISQLDAEIATEAQRRQQHQLDLKRQAQTLLQKGYQESLTRLRHWLAPQQLLHTYGKSLTLALQTGDFPLWLAAQLRMDADTHGQAVVSWVVKTSTFFNLPQPAPLQFSFPTEPILEFPDAATPTPKPQSGRTDNEVASVAIASGLGLVIGGPVGAAVFGGASYLLNQVAHSNLLDPNRLDPNPDATQVINHQLEHISHQAATAYLQQFSQAALQTLTAYEATVQPIIHCPLTIELRNQTTPQQHQVRFFTLTLATLEESLAKAAN
jgi:hypothetical protein